MKIIDSPHQPGIRVDGNNGGDSFGGGDLAGVDHNKELHEVVIHLPAPRLHDVHVLTTNRFTCDIYCYMTVGPFNTKSYILYCQSQRDKKYML